MGLGSWLDAIALTAGPERFFAKRAGKRGDPFRVRFPGAGEVLVTGHPDGARDVFSAPTEAFVPAGPNPVEPLLGAGSLILLGGEGHRRERKLLTPPFHGDRLRAYGRIIQERTQEEAATFAPGARVDIQCATRAITLDVIVRAVFGVREPAARARFHDAIVAMLEGYTMPLVAFPAARRGLFGQGPWPRFLAARERFRELLREEVAQRRREENTERDDVLTLLLSARYDDGSALGDDELLDELSTLLVAGHETTATALAWALHFLHRDSDLLEAVRAELAAGSDAPEALVERPLLGAVCQEALRLHPVVPIVLRRVVAPLTVRGVALEPGDAVAVAVTLLHTNPEIWRAPDRFMPDRFLTRRYSPFEYAPFGGGARRCIGAAFALYEMKVVLGTLLRLRRFGLASGPTPNRVVRNITMGPSEPLRLEARA
jgi:cytochrome P450